MFFSCNRYLQSGANLQARKSLGYFLKEAWYRRGKANASIQYYDLAMHDLEVSLCMEGSVSGKSQINEDLQGERTRLKQRRKFDFPSPVLPAEPKSIAANESRSIAGALRSPDVAFTISQPLSAISPKEPWNSIPPPAAYPVDTPVQRRHSFRR
ncbi:hypothetical protein KSP40_PGU009127 [Platanthera guangdongensis]|uniref:Uncharacterized protein n=1 Tax=Platanthera guangdongensis TaxID=2320717 RepID=A0ABR2M0N2_9ASPA